MDSAKEAVIPGEPWTSERLISCFSYEPPYVSHGMISIAEPAKLSDPQRRVISSSIGVLDVLPLELLHCVLSALDFRSLSRLSRVSHQGKAAVESLPAYREMTTYALRTLKALAQTELIEFHSSTHLRATLRCAQCYYCGEYGAFLFLLTCERCCYNCLNKNQSLRGVSLQVAANCFALTKAQLQQVPVLRTIPGRYNFHKVRTEGGSLVSVKHAKELAITIHGTMQRIRELLVLRYAPQTPRQSSWTYDYFRWMLDAPLNPLDQNPSTMAEFSSYANRYHDNCWGIPTIHFPSLSRENDLEGGLWCRGCKTTGVQDNTQDRARSRSDFLDHVKNHHGVQELAHELGLTLESE